MALGNYTFQRSIRKQKQNAVAVKIIYNYRTHHLFVIGSTYHLNTIYTIFTRIPFPTCQTTSFTMACYFIAYPRASTGKAAIPGTIISKQSDITLCQKKLQRRSCIKGNDIICFIRVASLHNVRGCYLKVRKLCL